MFSLLLLRVKFLRFAGSKEVFLFVNIFGTRHLKYLFFIPREERERGGEGKFFFGILVLMGFSSFSEQVGQYPSQAG